MPPPFDITPKALIRDGQGWALAIRRSLASKHWPGRWELPGGKPERVMVADALLARPGEVAQGEGPRDAASAAGLPGAAGAPAAAGGPEHEWVEPFERTLQREVQEETGLVIAPTRFLGAAAHDMPKARVIFIIVEATIQSGSLRLSPEHLEARWVSDAELASLDLIEPLAEALAYAKPR